VVRHTTDDLIYRYQPVLIQLRGVVMAAQFRYVVIYTFSGTALPALLFSWRLLGFGLMNAVVVTAFIAAPITYKVATFIEGDQTVKGLAQEARCDAAAWWAERVTNAHHVRDARPYRHRASRIRHIPGGP
jgi:hypothetical protein